MPTMTTLSWSEWIVALLRIACNTLSRRISARHVLPKLTLPHVAYLTAMITDATSGIGLYTAKLLSFPCGAWLSLGLMSYLPSAIPRLLYTSSVSGKLSNLKVARSLHSEMMESPHDK